jgi:hypothetical protein
MSAYISPTAALIGPTGIVAPTYAQILAYLTAQYQAIFGSDVYLGNDSQDGQLLAVFAQALSDANSAAIAAYNSFSPATAQGTGLSSNVQINGLTRLIPSFSTVSVTLTGVAHTVITNGQCVDTSGNVWALPTTTTIGSGGTVTVTATCTTVGAITANPSTVTGIQTPSYGWQSVTNPSAAVVGAPTETDAALRIRQSASTALPSLTVFEGVVAALENIVGVGRVIGYENNTSTGLVLTGGTIPANNLCYIVENGAVIQQAVFTAIFDKSTPGIPTYIDPSFPSQSYSEVVTDANDSSRTINFMSPTEAIFVVVCTVHPINGWNVTTVTLIENAIIAYANSTPIGSSISYFAVAAAITSLGTAPGETAPSQVGTFTLTSLTLNGGTSNLTQPYNQCVTLVTGDITVNVV